MNISFDSIGQYEFPNVILCNPDKTKLYSISSIIHDFKITLKYNASSEVTFKIEQSVNGVTIPAYDFLVSKRLILVDGIGYFSINEPVEDTTGLVPVKTVTGISSEIEMSYKKLIGFSGTYKLYDPITPSGTLLQTLIDQYIPTWAVGTVDPTVGQLYRSPSVSDSNVYNFLMNDVETAYGCVVTFDTINNLINVTSVTNATTPTSIFLSYDNLLQKGSLKEISSEITTVLHCYGDTSNSKAMDISLVNPLGTTAIYNFDYYKSTDWMSQGLVDAITSWENSVATQQPIYAGLLTNLEQYNIDLLTLQSQLSDLNITMQSYQDVKAARIADGQDYSDIQAEIDAQQILIDSQNSLIASKNIQIATTQSLLQSINTSLSFSNNFNPAQLLELNNFIFENTYQNKSIIQTDSMTPVDIQNMAQQLYSQGLSILQQVAVPRYELTLDTGNFVFQQQFKPFTDQLVLGCTVTINTKDGYPVIVPTLLQMEITYDDPTKFVLTFSNSLRLVNGKFIFTDLFGQNVKTTSSVNFNQSQWSNWSTNYQDTVTTFISSALDTTVNNIISDSNQSMLIDQNGIRIRQYDSVTQTFKPNQMWLTNNVLAFSNDGFNTAKLALGQVTVGTTTSYGLIADVVVGHLLAGNSLSITNSGGNFQLDQNGAVLTNATLSVINSTNLNKILLDPNNGFRIQKNIAGTWTDQFFVDNSGNVNFTGILNGASGTFTGSVTANTGSFGGWTITSTGISDSLGNYINSNGNVKIGALSINGSTASFAGTIYANNIFGTVQNSQIGSNLDASKIGFNTMSGDRVYGGTIGWNGVTLGTSGTGVSTLTAAQVQLSYNSGNSVFGNVVEIFSNNGIQIEGSVVKIYGGFAMNGAVGLSATISLSSPYGTIYMTFTNGVFTSYYY